MSIRPERHFTFANQQAAAFYGHATPQEMIGASAFDLVTPQDRQRMIENTRKTIETGSVRPGEYVLLRKDGAPFPAELRVSIIRDERDLPVAVIGITRDITARKQAVEKLQRLSSHYLRTELLYPRIPACNAV